MNLLTAMARSVWPALLALARRLALPGLWLLAGTSHAADPAWWQTRGAVVAASTPAPYAVVNQGQLKAFTVGAVAELNARLPGGAGDALNTLVAGWRQDYATHAYATDPGNPTRPYKPADFDAVSVGQLKYVASLLYGRLRDAGYASLYPAWITVHAGTDNQLAVLGQLKTVFNFDLSLDPDGSGLSLAWEQQYFGQTGVDPDADPDGDGLTNRQEYQQGSDPTDFYNGRAPTPVIIGGGDQRGAPGTVLQTPLAVQVAHRQSAALHFAVTAGGALLSTSRSGSPAAAALDVTAGNAMLDADGYPVCAAQVYVVLPGVNGTVSTVTVSTAIQMIILSSHGPT